MDRDRDTVKAPDSKQSSKKDINDASKPYTNITGGNKSTSPNKTLTSNIIHPNTSTCGSSEAKPCSSASVILNAIDELRVLIASNISETEYLRNEIRTLKNSNLGDKTVTASFSPLKELPCSTVEDFNLFEAKIRDDPKAVKSLEYFLDRETDQSLMKYIRACLKSILTDFVAKEYTWHGKNQNIPVQDFRVIFIVEECARKKFPSAKTVDIIKVIKTWFLYAKDRLRKAGLE